RWARWRKRSSSWPRTTPRTSPGPSSSSTAAGTPATSRAEPRKQAMDIGIELLFDGSPGNSITDAGGFAKALEDMGFASLWLPDHVVVFEQYAPNYGYSENGLPPYAPRQGWFDPLFGLAAMAATTSRIRLGTNCLILPERNPVVLAKEVVALDHLSGGRIDLGVGLGWSPEEFAACSVPFERRGARCEDYIAAMTCLWTDEVATYGGEL